MKCNQSQIFERLYKKALESICRYRIAAIGIDYRGTPITIANNQPRNLYKGGGIHAEQRVMYKSPKSLKKIIIIRVGDSGEVRPIEPCDICAEKAAELGIKIESIK